MGLRGADVAQHRVVDRHGRRPVNLASIRVEELDKSLETMALERGLFWVPGMGQDLQHYLADHEGGPEVIDVIAIRGDRLPPSYDLGASKRVFPCVPPDSDKEVGR